MAQVMMRLNLQLRLMSHLTLLRELLLRLRLLRRSNPHQSLLVHVFRELLPRRAPTMAPELCHRGHLAFRTASHYKMEYLRIPTIRQQYVASLAGGGGQPCLSIWQSYDPLATRTHLSSS